MGPPACIHITQLCDVILASWHHNSAKSLNSTAIEHVEVNFKISLTFSLALVWWIGMYHKCSAYRKTNAPMLHADCNIQNQLLPFGRNGSNKYAWIYIYVIYKEIALSHLIIFIASRFIHIWYLDIHLRLSKNVMLHLLRRSYHWGFTRRYGCWSKSTY